MRVVLLLAVILFELYKYIEPPQLVRMLPISEIDFFQDISFLQSIIASIQEGVIILNSQGRIVSFNEQATAILNLRHEQLLDKSPKESNWNAIQPDGSILLAENLPVIITLKTGKPQSNVLLGVITGNDPVKWLSINSRMLRTNDDEVFVFATFIDVTKLVLSNQSLQEEQEKLKASEEKFAKSFNYSAIGKAIVSVTGELKEVNEAFCRMLGYTKEELLQKTFHDITHADDLEKDVSLVNRMLKREIENYQLEKRYIHKNGTTIWALLNVALVWNAQHEPQFFVSQVQEITEIKKLNTWLEERNVELLKTQTALERKIGQLKDFAGIITHDVRGPAHNIKKMLEMYETAKDEEIKKASFYYLKKVSDDLAANLNELVNILQIHLEKELPYSNCDLNSIADSVCLQLQDIIEQKSAVISKDFQVPNLAYPKIYMRSILYNLVSNSLKYQQEDSKPVIRITSFLKNNQVYLSVADNGLGIDMNRHGKSLFKFQKSFHAGFESKGIGLYLIRNQVENLGGTIVAESEPGKGTTMTVRF